MDERARDARLRELAARIQPNLGSWWNQHGMVTLKRQSLSRLLYYNQLYQEIVDVPGVICEFGVQWGTTLAQLINLRGIYEPYNHSRTIVGFDTFDGFASVEAQDNTVSRQGDYATMDDYEDVLTEILNLHESFCPLPHIQKFELVRGDAVETIGPWLESNPHAIVAMAIFDMDLYAPTKAVLEQIAPRLTKGSVLAFDELNCAHFPGETLALREVMGLGELRLRRFPHQSYCAWAKIGD